MEALFFLFFFLPAGTPDKEVFQRRDRCQEEADWGTHQLQGKTRGKEKVFLAHCLGEKKDGDSPGVRRGLRRGGAERRGGGRYVKEERKNFYCLALLCRGRRVLINRVVVPVGLSLSPKLKLKRVSHLLRVSGPPPLCSRYR